MKDINNVLIVSELNKESYEALAYGITLGLMFEAQIHCIHVIKPSPIDLIKETFSFGTDSYNRALKEAKEESSNLLGHIIDVISQELGIGELNVDLKIVSGPLEKSINGHAKHINADVIVLGVDPGMKYMNSQNTNLALSLIEGGTTNVLLIPSGFRMERIDQIGAFVNYEMHDLQFVHKLLNLSSRTEFGLKLFHVAKHEVAVENVERRLKSFEHLFSEAIRAKKLSLDIEIGSLSTIVNELSEKHNIDLMVMRTNKRHWDIYSSISNFSEKVIRNIKIPLFVWTQNDDDLKDKETIRQSLSYLLLG